MRDIDDALQAVTESEGDTAIYISWQNGEGYVRRLKQPAMFHVVYNDGDGWTVTTTSRKSIKRNIEKVGDFELVDWNEHGPGGEVVGVFA